MFGRVLTSPGGKPIPDARVTLDSGALVATDSTGTFSFPKLEFGRYVISVKAGKWSCWWHDKQKGIEKFTTS